MGSTIPGSASENYKQLLKKIAEHGSTVVEVIDLEWDEGRSVKSERVLILLEMLFKKGTKGSITAAVYYMDRLLGKPKESLNLTNGADLIGKLTDDQLLEKISNLLEKSRKGGAGKSD